MRLSSLSHDRPISVRHEMRLSWISHARDTVFLDDFWNDGRRTHCANPISTKLIHNSLHINSLSDRGFSLVFENVEKYILGQN